MNAEIINIYYTKQISKFKNVWNKHTTDMWKVNRSQEQNENTPVWVCLHASITRVWKEKRMRGRVHVVQTEREIKTRGRTLHIQLDSLDTHTRFQNTPQLTYGFFILLLQDVVFIRVFMSRLSSIIHGNHSEAGGHFLTMRLRARRVLISVCLSHPPAVACSSWGSKFSVALISLRHRLAHVTSLPPNKEAALLRPRGPASAVSSSRLGLYEPPQTQHTT